MGFAVGVGVVVAAGGLIAHGVFESAFSFFELTVLVPLFVCFYGIAQSFLYLNLRANRVPLIASLKIAQSVFTGGAQALLAGMGAVSGLVVGSVAGWTLVGGFGLVFHFSNRLAWADLRARAFAAVFRRNRRFPRYVLPNVIVDNFSNQLPTVLIGAFASLTSAGHYGLAIMVLSAPAALVSQAVGQVFLQHIGRVKDGGWVYARTMFRIWAVMSALGLAPFGAVAIFAPSLFAFAFGSQWVGAGLAAQALAPLLFLRFVSSPTSSIYLRLGLQRQQWWFGCAALVYRAGSYSLPIFGFDIYVAILTHVILEMIAIFAYNLAALYFMTKPSWGSKVVG
jgi:O-antigen/teichoic acid export membrane protein